MTAQATRAATCQAPPTAAVVCAGDLALLQVDGPLAPEVLLLPEQQMRQTDRRVEDHLLRSSPEPAAADAGEEVLPDYLL